MKTLTVLLLIILAGCERRHALTDAVATDTNPQMHFPEEYTGFPKATPPAGETSR